MNSDAFLRHHGLASNPFRGEEARQDAVFDLIESGCRHPDFEKILGDPNHPAAAVVFGERGSGKTAMRLQIQSAIDAWNEAHPDSRCMVVGHDEFNPMLGAIARTIGRPGGTDDPDATLAAVTLADHLDMILASAVPPVVEAVNSGKAPTAGPLAGLAEARRRMRAASLAQRRALQRLQAVYDTGPDATNRGDRLRRVLQVPGGPRLRLVLAAAIAAMVLAVAWSVAVATKSVAEGAEAAMLPTFLLFGVSLLAGAWWMWSRLRLARAARRRVRVVRGLGRDADAAAAALRRLPAADLASIVPPGGTGGDEWRIERLAELVDVLRSIGVDGTIVLIDRVDEPVAVNGVTARMKALAWPLFRNKVLQMPGVGMKFLLPLELRDELMRERAEFFREARLDKQNLVERLVWSGAMLFDLCNARLRACAEGEQAPSLMDLFDETVTRQDVVDALDHMQQPRDAFKLLYGLVQEHCSNVVEEEASFQIGRTTLDLVRKRQVERKEGMLRGTRPG
jgi:hypothetical protein